MSAERLVLYPKDVGYVPDRAAIAEALALLADLTLAREVDAQETLDLAFVDAGENAGVISCAHCAAPVNLTWWSEQMTHAHTQRFRERAIAMPCCGAPSSLDALAYAAGEGFARFTLSALDPEQLLSDDAIRRLEATLGCSLGVVHAHV